MVTSVGGTKVVVEGRGTVDLISKCEGRTHALQLQHVLHIPTNKNNLISLGKWDSAGRSYQSNQGILKLITKRGITIAVAKRVENNLYKIQVGVREIATKPHTQDKYEMFMTIKPFPSWETWHKRFGHVSYSRLQKLWEKNLVYGFNVNTQMPKPDCVVCTEAKQNEEPHNKEIHRQTRPGELTHIDMWGQYEIASINGHQYFILFVDDAMRYITVNFLKRKDDAAQAVKDYLTYLETHRKSPCAIHTDQGKEFINKTLKSWCHRQGIKNQMTAPYSPAQNGVAKRANQTLVELACAMKRGQDIPEFLWEHVVAHVAYIWNCSYTRMLQNVTPYELWFQRKPNIAHLREFGEPVWVLLQGQAEQRKILPKSKRCAYVGFEDGSQAVKYYNPENRKVLTSQNYRFLTLPKEDPPPDIIKVTPNTQHKGESRGDTLSMGDALTMGVQPNEKDKSQGDKQRDGDSLKRKQTIEKEEEEEMIDHDIPRKT